MIKRRAPAPGPVSVELPGIGKPPGPAFPTAVNLRSLDALRGMLAMFVLLHHARWLLWTGHENWIRFPHPVWQRLLEHAAIPLRFGHEAVIVFFVLSGFFIHLRAAGQMAANKTAVLDVPAFFRRRAHRLVPPYLLALAVTVALDAWGTALYPRLYNGQTGDGLLDGAFVRSGYSLRSVIPAALMLPDSTGWQFGSNGPLWSLAYEVAFYLMYPGWLWLRRRGWFAGYVLGGLGAMAAALPFATLGFVPLVLVHFPIWLAGAALAEAVPRIAPTRALRWLLLPAALVTTLGLTLLQPPLPVLMMLYAFGGSAAVLWCALLPESMSNNPMHRLWERAGLGSYTVYVIHFPVLTLLSAMTMRWCGDRPTSGWLALGGACVAAMFCVLCYWFCERRFLHHKLPTPPVSH